MKTIGLLAFSIALSSFSLAQNAEQIMSAVRQSAVLQENQVLQGVIRKGPKKVPITLFLKGQDIQFVIDGGKEGFHLRLKKEEQELWEIVGGKPRRFQAEKIGAPIAGTDLSYEDLALKFLYWENPWIVGTQKLNGMDCWYLHVINPDKTGRYREVSVWVTKKHMALARVLGYGPKPDKAPLKQFEIIDVMKVNGVFTVETMKVTQYAKDRTVSGVTYLEFDK
ncbi:MAG: hypothetical protein ACJAVK_002904 [Akkermansiaceae bacterium]|jgi:hypothetical protein